MFVLGKSSEIRNGFSGEHRSALYITYSFIILAQDKIGLFQTKVRELRERHGLLEPYSEFAYKDLRFGARNVYIHWCHAHVAGWPKHDFRPMH